MRGDGVGCSNTGCVSVPQIDFEDSDLSQHYLLLWCGDN